MGFLGQGRHDPDLVRLLVSLHGERRRWTTLRAETRQWHRLGTPSEPREESSVVRVWMSGFESYREEVVEGPKQGAIVVRGDAGWWTFDPADGEHTSDEAGQGGVGTLFFDDLLHTIACVHQSGLGSVGEDVLDDRWHVITCAAAGREDDGHQPFGDLDAVRLWIDAETGGLRRLHGFRDGAVCSTLEVRSVAFDEGLDAGLFAPLHRDPPQVPGRGTARGPRALARHRSTAPRQRPGSGSPGRSVNGAMS